MVQHTPLRWLTVMVSLLFVSCYDEPNQSNPLEGQSPNLFLPEVSHPIGGEQFFPGTTQEIRWNPATLVEDAVVTIRLECGTVTQIIASDVQNTGTYSWQVPDTPSPDCRIRITGSNGPSELKGAFRINPLPVLARLEIDGDGYEPTALRDEVVFTSRRSGNEDLWLFDRIPGQTQQKNPLQQLTFNAYIYQRDGDTWTEVAFLRAGDGITEDFFGISVSLSGNYALVGATGSNLQDPRTPGKAYVFRRDGDTWTQVQKLTADDGIISDSFGSGVALDGNYALVNAPGLGQATYVFRRDGDTWTQVQKLPWDGRVRGWFTSSVAIDGNYALISTLGHNDGPGTFFKGAAYVLQRDGDTWTEVAKLTSDDQANDDRFGTSLSLDGDYALIGARFNDEHENNAGAAYVFQRNGDDWIQIAKLAADDATEFDSFGASVALGGDHAIVGAGGKGIGGAAYVFSGISELGVATVSAEPLSIDMGAVDVDAVKDTTFTLTNTGADTLHIDSITAGPAVFTIRDTILALAPGEAYTDTVHVQPILSGPVHGALTITSNAPDSLYSLPLHVRGVPLPVVLASDTSTVVYENADSSKVQVRFSAGPLSGHSLMFDHYGQERPPSARSVPGFDQPLFYFEVATSLPDSMDFTADVTIDYTQIQLDSAGVTDENSLTAASFDSTNLVWMLMPTTLDTSANTAVFTTDHFSTWALASTGPTGIADPFAAAPSGSPPDFTLKQNYPNPFNPATTIRFELPRTSVVSLRVYNLLGQEITILLDAVNMPAGGHTVIWDGRSRTGRQVASGIYLYRLTGKAGFSQTRRMILVK